MKKYFLLAIFMPVLSFSQELVTYNSLEDYNNDKGTTYEEYISNSYVGRNYTLKLQKDGEKVKVQCGDIWGFTYKNAFFRVPEGEAQPYRLIMEGKICYWEDGSSHLKLLKNPEASAEMNGNVQYFSKNKFGEMIHYAYNLSKSLKKSHPEYAEVFDCVKSTMKEMNINGVQSFKFCCLKYNGAVMTE